MPGCADLITVYQAAGFPESGDELGLYGAFVFDAAVIDLEAIDRADSIDPADIRDEVAATADYDGVVGSFVGFDADGVVIPQWAWMSVYHNGKWADVVLSKMYLPVISK
jgi:hypothetical protein